MLQAPPLVAPALRLRRILDSGALFTPWAEKRCGQKIRADVERARPLHLTRAEAALFGLDPAGTWECLRRSGYLVQEDGTRVARVRSLVSLARAEQADGELVMQLNTTDIPLGTLLGGHGRSVVLSASVGITECAVSCERAVCWDNIMVAVTADWVLWSWLAGLPADG